MLSIEVALRLNQPKHYPSRKRDKIHWDLGNSVVVLRWNSLGNSHFALKLGCCYSHQNKMMNSKFSTLTLSSHTPGRDLVCRLKKLFSCQLTQTNQNELLVTIYVFAEYFNLKFMLVNLFLYYAVVNALHKCWCVQHFTCIGCNISLNLKWVIACFFLHYWTITVFQVPFYLITTLLALILCVPHHLFKFYEF